MPYQRNLSGLSLIELIIALAIIGIIASVAIPSYNNLILDNRRKDAQIALFNLQQAVEMIRLAHGKIKVSEVGKLSDKSELKFYNLEFAGDDNTYKLIARPIGGQAADEYCGEFSIDNFGQKAVSGYGGIENCWH